MRQRHGMAGQCAQRRALDIDQQQILAGGECHCLAVGAPGKTRGPARRAMQQARVAPASTEIPQPDTAILATAGQQQAFWLPGKIQHTRRMFTQRLHCAISGRDTEQAAFAATNSH